MTLRWARLRAEVGRQDVRIHDLRRFVAIELLTAWIEVRAVSNRLGHARTSTTMVCWAWVPAGYRDGADHLEPVLSATHPTPSLSPTGASEKTFMDQVSGPLADMW